YLELRSRLGRNGHKISTKSDAEILVHLYEEYGDSCVQLLQGMFAFALWDESRHRLLLARDRLGLKPLYYAKTRHGLAFASEAKALFEPPDIRADVNSEALTQSLTLRYVTQEDTLFRGVKRLPPGHLLVHERGRTDIRRYWQLVLGDFQPAVNLDEAVE